MRKGNPYNIGLRDSTHQTIAQIRRVYRETDVAACDAAMRWLRLHRNAQGDTAEYDTWFVSKLVGPQFKPQRLAEGTLNVGQTDAPRDRTYDDPPVQLSGELPGGTPPRGRGVSLPFQQ